MAVKMITFPDREDWLKGRGHTIGGSDASAVIGVNPYKNNQQLWLEKTGQVIPDDISDKHCVQFGIGAEPLLRELFKITYPKYEMGYVDNNSWLNDKYPFAAASLDGWLIEKDTGRKGIWECKTSEIVSSMHKEKWNKQIPQNYYCQLLHYLMVCEDCEFAKLTALLTFNFGEAEVYQQIKHYHIERSDVADDIEYLSRKEETFWRSVQTKQKPYLILPEI